MKTKLHIMIGVAALFLGAVIILRKYQSDKTPVACNAGDESRDV